MAIPPFFVSSSANGVAALCSPSSHLQGTALAAAQDVSEEPEPDICGHVEKNQRQQQQQQQDLEQEEEEERGRQASPRSDLDGHPGSEPLRHVHDDTPCSPPSIDPDPAPVAAPSSTIVAPPPSEKAVLTPDQLDALVEQRTLTALRALGGTRGVLSGLKVDPSLGLESSRRDGPEAGKDGGGDAEPVAKDTSLTPLASLTSLASRRSVYGANILPSRRAKSILSLAWTALKDKVLVILCAAAVVSLALGIYQAVGVPPERVRSPSCPDTVNGCPVAQVDWVEGVAIVVAIAVCVLVGALNDWQKDRQFIKLEKVKDDRTCVVVRDGGVRQQVNTKDLVVGDICVVVPGDVLPVDGVLLPDGASGVRCDESGATGESERVSKEPEHEHEQQDGDDEKAQAAAAAAHPLKDVSSVAVVAPHHPQLPPLGSRRSTFSTISTLDDQAAATTTTIIKRDDGPNPFLLSGSRVTDGSGRYVVLAVGERSFNGKILASELRKDAGRFKWLAIVGY